MWIFAYDPADEDHVQRRDLSFWPLRHGSPIRDTPGVWVPTSFVPCLGEFSETGDLYVGHLPDEPGPDRQRFYTREDRPSRELFETLSGLTPDDFALALEFTYHTNWGSNGIQRLQILYESVARGIPTIYAIPESGIALRGTERRGDQNVRQSELKEALTPHCRDLVEANEPVTFEAIQDHLADDDTDLDVELGETASNVADPKVPLFCRTMQDTFEVPCCTVQYDEVVTAVPRDWKVAGCQLEPVFEVIEAAMAHIERTGEAPPVDSGIFDAHNAADDAVMADSPPGRRGDQRHSRWDEYHLAGPGFPNGSLGIVSEPVERHSTDHNYSLPAPRLADLFVHPGDRATRDSLEQWTAEVGRSRAQTRMYGSVDVDRVPEPVRDRPMIITFNVSAYGGSRDHIDRWQNVDERTYAGKFVLIDVCCARSPVDADDRPRAMAPAKTDRAYVLAANLPMPADELFDHHEENARYRTYVDLADLLVFDDGGYLGRIWWEDDEPVRVF